MATRKLKKKTTPKRKTKTKARRPAPKRRYTRAKAKLKSPKRKVTAKRTRGRKTRAGKGTKPAKKTRPGEKRKVSRKRGAVVKKVSAGTASRRRPVRASRSSRSVVSSRPRILPREFLIGLGLAIRKAVAATVRSAKGREIMGTASSGDATFRIDKIGEKALMAYLRESKLAVAYYSEDAGYTTFTTGQPQNLLIVDPVDGTRAAKSGFEGCVVSVGSTRVIERPRIGDVDNACVIEILGDRIFYAERGKGARMYVDGHVKKPKPSRTTNLETVSWSMTVPARPAELIFPTAAKLIDLTSLKGGFFACNSTSYSLTRLLTNQLDACVDFANRYLRDIPAVVEDQFINAGRGVILGIAPYDIAASLLIAEEAGCVVTDAYGESLDEVLLLDSSVSNHRSMIAASNSELHEKLMSFFVIRINQFEQLLVRRADPAS